MFELLPKMPPLWGLTLAIVISYKCFTVGWVVFQNGVEWKEGVWMNILKELTNKSN